MYVGRERIKLVALSFFFFFVDEYVASSQTAV